MKIKLIIIVLFINTLAFSAINKGITISVRISPAGNFEAKSSRIKGGKVLKDGDSLEVNNIFVPTKSIKTGIDLRDEHLQKKLGNQDVTVLHAKGKDGKGKGKIKINGVTKDFNLTYKILSKKYVQGEFKLKLSDFKINDVSYLSVGVEDEVKIKAIVKYKEKSKK